MAKNMLKQTDMVALADLMRQHCKKTPEGAVYEEGWSDQRLTDEFPGRATINNVRNLRENLMGELKKTRPETPTDAVKRLHEEVGHLRQYITKLEEEVSRLQRWAAARSVQPYHKG